MRSRIGCSTSEWRLSSTPARTAGGRAAVGVRGYARQRMRVRRSNGFRTFRIENWRLGRVCMLGQPRFQVGNSTVLEPQVGPGSCETFVERATRHLSDGR